MHTAHLMQLFYDEHADLFRDENGKPDFFLFLATHLSWEKHHNAPVYSPSIKRLIALLSTNYQAPSRALELAYLIERTYGILRDEFPKEVTLIDYAPEAVKILRHLRLTQVKNIPKPPVNRVQSGIPTTALAIIGLLLLALLLSLTR